MQSYHEELTRETFTYVRFHIISYRNIKCVNWDVPEILTYLSSRRAGIISGEGNSILKGVKGSDLNIDI